MGPKLWRMNLIINSEMNNMERLVVNEQILNIKINDFNNQFIDVHPHEAQKLLGDSRCNILYKGKPLYFLDHQVSNLGIYHKKNTSKTQRFTFEIPYHSEDLFDDLMDYFGAPYTIIPKTPPYLDARENLEYFKDYGLQNCVEFAWHKEGDDFFVTATNLLEYTDCYPEKQNVIWITYRFLKD